jgi:KamA family protein
MDYKAYNATTFAETALAKGLPRATLEDLLVVSKILPFRVNNYVVERLIDWRRAPDDPMFRMLFPNRDMLSPADYAAAVELHRRDALPSHHALVKRIRASMNPHPSGQLSHNRPYLHGEVLKGIQHKYRETVLFFPNQGQTCHAYCAFCFRWAQFIGDDELKIASRDREQLFQYLEQHEEVTDLLITGGDPLVMRTQLLRFYCEPLLAGRCPHIRSVRFGTKALAFWPYRFTTGQDADALAALLSELMTARRNVAIMAHMSHPRELETEEARAAVLRLRGLGVVLRSQAPLLRTVNDAAETWAAMWRLQVSLGVVPYYMFVERVTGAHRYFGLPLARAITIFQDAVTAVSGLARTVRGPVMSTHQGKVEILGRVCVADEELFALRFLQAREATWSFRPFFARYDATAEWLDDLQPPDASRFFFQREAEREGGYARAQNDVGVG